MSKLKIDYFSDVLCIWAYSGHVRVDELCKEFGDEIELNYRFVPIFGAAKQRIARGWKDKDGFKGFNRHMQEVAAKWDHIQIHKDIWLHQAPTSSNVPHLYIKAAQLLQSQNLIPAQAQEAFNGRTVIEELIWRIRAAFFEHCRNISDIAVLNSIAKELQLPVNELHSFLESGDAHAELHLDLEAKEKNYIPGSPALVFNEGRQILYGNVGYRIIQANIKEILADPQFGDASWC